MKKQMKKQLTWEEKLRVGKKLNHKDTEELKKQAEKDYWESISGPNIFGQK